MKKTKWITILFLIALTLFSLSFFRIDPDYLWHIKAGEYMFHHGVLRSDVFSWSVYSKYWMSHEWLFEILIYSLKSVFGSFHLFLYTFVMTFLLLLTIYIGNKKQLTSNYLFTIVWFSCSLILSFMMQGRPHLISNCLLSLSIYFLYDLYKNEESKKIYFLPLISILWANVHGGSSNLPYLFCFIFMTFGSFQFSFSKIEAKRIHKKQYIKYFVVMLLCMIGVCINIHGFKMLLYPYQNMMDTTMLQNITEWIPTNLNEPSHYAYFGLLLLCVSILLFSKKKIEFIDFILLGFSAYLGLKSIRFWFYTYIIMSYIVFYYVPKRKMDKGTEFGVVIISLLLIGLFIARCDAIFHVDYRYLLSSKDIEVIEREQPKRLYNMYNYGGDLVYQGIPVFIDGRADLYGKHNYKDYLNLSVLQGDYVSIIEKYQFDYFLVDQIYPISTYLHYDSNYDLIYQNDDVLLYKKKN